MKAYQFNFNVLSIALSLALFWTAESQAQLSGTYTLDPTKPASNTNYGNWSSVISDLQNGTRSDGGTAQGSGVNGKVTVTVYDTVYTSTRLSLGSITGTSSSNTITFRSAGKDSSACIVQNASSSSAGNDYVLQFNGCNYITFKDIGFERTGSNTYSTVVNVTNNSDYNTLEDCWLKGRKINSNSSNGFQYGIGSIIYFTGNGDNFTVDNCKLIYGYNGVYGTSSCSNNTFINNVIDTSGSSGIYLTSQSNLQIEGNTFYMGDFGPNRGHYTSYGMRIESSPSMEITKNKVYMLAVNGQVVRAIILANTTSTSSSPSLVNNNWILNAGGTGDCTGLAVYNCQYIDFYYNNILITNSIKAGAAYYHYAQYTNSNINLVNNNLINTGGGYTYNVPGNNTTDLVNVNYNNLYSTGSNLSQWGGTDYSNLSAHVSGSSKDSNSLSIDPGFVNNLDLHVSNIGINGKAIPYSNVKDDIDGDTRNSNTPDIGADEFFPAKNDAGVSRLDSPAAFCAGKSNVLVSITNFGIDTLKSADIYWSVNGTSQGRTQWTGNVPPGDASGSIKLGDYTFSANTPYTFRIWTSQPNSSNDGKTINDTLEITRLTGLSGTYTIGSASSSDYKSFNDAITAMTSRGVCGAVTFNVADGTYNEQLTITELGGVNVNNPVIFQGVSQDSSKVKITLPSTTATGNNNAVVQLRGADYVTFRHMTFERTGTNAFAQVIHILDGADYNTFSNCQMLATKVTSNNADGVNIWSDQDQDIGNSFINNLVKYGTYSMQYTGVSAAREFDTRIEGNIFDSAYANTLDIGFNDNLLVNRNTFRNPTNSVAGNYDLRLAGCDSMVMISNNLFQSSRTESGIYMVGCYGAASSHGTIANNWFTKVDGKGIVMDGVEYFDIIFNSMYFSGSDNTNAGINSTNNNQRFNVCKNNCIVMDAGYALDMQGNRHFAQSDFNNLFTRGNLFVRWGGTAYANIGALRNNVNVDSHSVSVNPLYTSATDLHVKNPALHGVAEYFSSVPTDIDGELRDTTPDIGSDEFQLEPNDAGIERFISPVNGVCAGTKDVDVVLKNFGGDTLKSVTIDWTVGGNAQSTYNWTGNLASKEMDTITVGSFAFQGNTQPKIVVYTSSPNSQSDAFTVNDSVEVSRLIIGLPNARAGSDQAICLGDSVEIGTKGFSYLDYEWYDANNQLLGTEDKVWVNPTTTGNYYISVLDATFGCINTDTVEVIVNALPQANAGGNDTICAGETTTLGASAKTGFSYEWTSTNGLNSNAAQPIVSPSSQATYYVKETNDSTGCEAVDSAIIAVNSLPSPTISGVNQSCANAPANYQALGGTNSQFSWSISGPAQIMGNTMATNAFVAFTGAGDVNVVLRETDANGCVDSTDMEVDVFAVPAAGFTVEGNCATRDVTFADTSENVLSRDWEFGDGNTAKGVSTIHRYNSAGQYAMSLVVENSNGCRDTALRNLTIVEPAKASFEIDKACANRPVVFDNTSTNANSYRWTFGNGSSSTDENPTTTYSIDRTFSIKLVAIADGCADSIVKAVSINPLPNPDFSGEVFRDSVELTPDVTGAAGYEWDFGDGNTSADENPIYEYNDKFRENVTVKLTITDENGCSDTSSQRFYIDISNVQMPEVVSQLQAYPNPFSHELQLAFNLAQPSQISWTVYSLQGQQLFASPAREMNAGSQQLSLSNGLDALPLGTYLLQFEVNGEPIMIQLQKQ